MSKDILLGAFYQDSTGLGVTGLTVTIDIWRVALADLAKSEIVTAGSVTEIGDGVYAYRVASADLQTYYYFGVCKTAGTVAQKHLAAVQLDFADSPGLVTLIWNALTSGMTTAGSIGKRIVDYLTGDVYARLGAPAGASIAADIAALPASVWAAATRTLTSVSALAAQIASAVLDAVAASYNTSGTIGAKITTAAGAAGGGSSTYTVTVTDANGATLDGVQCWATTDAAGANTVASGVSNSHGQVTFALDPGSYYLWRQRAGTNFTNPAGFTVT